MKTFALQFLILQHKKTGRLTFKKSCIKKITFSHCLYFDVLFAVRRDLWCRDTKFDFGFEVLRYHSFWMAEHHDIERMSKTGIDLKQCFERCQNISCISFSSEYSDSRCTLHFGHKYTPEYHRWWIEGVNPGNVCYQRLCFKGLNY